MRAVIHPHPPGTWHLPRRPNNKKAKFVYWAYVFVTGKPPGEEHSWTVFTFAEHPPSTNVPYKCDVEFVSPHAPLELVVTGSRWDLFLGVREKVGVLEIL